MGYGVNAYLDIIKHLMIMMAVITTIMLPFMLGMAKFGALE